MIVDEEAVERLSRAACSAARMPSARVGVHAAVSRIRLASPLVASAAFEAWCLSEKFGGTVSNLPAAVEARYRTGQDVAYSLRRAVSVAAAGKTILVREEEGPRVPWWDR